MGFRVAHAAAAAMPGLAGLTTGPTASAGAALIDGPLSFPANLAAMLADATGTADEVASRNRAE
jgi:hypothetical protein